MKIFYLHGLESSLTAEKREILERHATVIAPKIDYYESRIFDKLMKYIDFEDITHIGGSSMGGFVGWHIARMYDKKCLLFNPAFPFDYSKFDISTDLILPTQKTTESHFVLGKLDTRVNYSENLHYINTHLTDFNPKIRTVEDLAHGIPVTVFEEQFNLFFQNK